MSENPGTPLIVQSDHSLMMDVHDPGFEVARGEISPFAELEKSPEHMHTYRISPLSLWNAASAGLTPSHITETLDKWSRFPVPENVKYQITDTISRFGKLVLHPGPEEGQLYLEITEEYIRKELPGHKSLQKYLVPYENGFLIEFLHRGTIKQALIKLGYPVKDEVPLRPGDPLDVKLIETTKSGKPFNIRDYQKDASNSFLGDGKPGSGFGALVLPCGAGKTIIGIDVMVKLGMKTLILATNVAAARQWMREIIDKTSLTEDEVGEYSGRSKEIKPVTVATYQVITWRPDKNHPFPHFPIFHKENWGLIIYDEVHLLPAPVFRVTAEIQAIRRLGLTATLIREDGREDEVFCLVGPKRYDVPWKDLEARGWIAEANCKEIRVPLPEDLMMKYATATPRTGYRIACENPVKIEVAKYLLKHHRGEPTLVIGQYLTQLKELSDALNAPIITGKTPNSKREELFGAFRNGEIKVLVVSKVANFSIDLPDASIAIQVSGTFGSRQEEAQRLGRILRPKERSSYFYSLVSSFTSEETFGANRQKFLTEQGYKYTIEQWDS
ncbi:MAG: DEAD/DEAH box helicase [Spirochaetales bacterium]|nr:DEAD/DEAH box helicase [Spirochaetales bacterium]